MKANTSKSYYCSPVGSCISFPTFISLKPKRVHRWHWFAPLLVLDFTASVAVLAVVVVVAAAHAVHASQQLSGSSTVGLLSCPVEPHPYSV